MQKLLFTLLTLVSVLVSLSAQRKASAEWQQVEKAMAALQQDRKNKKMWWKATLAVESALKQAEGQERIQAHLLKGALYAEMTAERLLLIRQAEKAPSSVYSNRPLVLEAYQSYQQVLLEGEKRRDKLTALKGLERLQQLLLEESLLKLGWNKREKVVFLEQQALWHIHQRLKEKGRSSVLESDLSWFKYQLALSSFYNQDLSTCGRLAQGLLENHQPRPALYLMMYEVEKHRSTPGLAYRYISEGRAKFPTHHQLMEAEIRYFLAEHSFQDLRTKYPIAKHQFSESTLEKAANGMMQAVLFKVCYEQADTLAARRYFVASEHIFSHLCQDPSTLYLGNLGMLRLYRLQIDVLLKELLVLGELCSPTVLRLYEQKKEEILEVVRKIAPFLTALLDSHPQHLEALEAARRFNAMQENLIEMRRFQSRLLEARLQPKNWDTYVLPSSVVRE